MTRPGAQFNSFSDLLSLMLGLTILNDVFLCSRSLNKWQWSWFDTAINCQINHPQSSCAIVHSQESNFIPFIAFYLRSAALTVFYRIFPSFCRSNLDERRNSLIWGDFRSLLFSKGYPSLNRPAVGSYSTCPEYMTPEEQKIIPFAAFLSAGSDMRRCNCILHFCLKCVALKNQMVSGYMSD